jgi:hypothetical protein
VSQNPQYPESDARKFRQQMAAIPRTSTFPVVFGNTTAAYSKSVNRTQIVDGRACGACHDERTFCRHDADWMESSDDAG